MLQFINNLMNGTNVYKQMNECSTISSMIISLSTKPTLIIFILTVEASFTWLQRPLKRSKIQIKFIQIDFFSNLYLYLRGSMPRDCLCMKDECWLDCYASGEDTLHCLWSFEVRYHFHCKLNNTVEYHLHWRMQSDNEYHFLSNRHDIENLITIQSLEWYQQQSISYFLWHH